MMQPTLDMPRNLSSRYRPRTSARYIVASVIVTRTTGAGLPTKRYATQPETDEHHVRQ